MGCFLSQKIAVFLVFATALAACAPADGPVAFSTPDETQSEPARTTEQAPATPHTTPPTASSSAPTSTPAVPQATPPQATPPQTTAAPVATPPRQETPAQPTITYSAPTTTEAPTTLQQAPAPQQAAAPRAQTQAQSQAPRTYDQELLNLINASRAQGNLPPLRLSRAESSGVGQCAGSYGHSVHMQQVGHISHDEFPADICVSSPAEAENVGMSSGDEEYALNAIHQGMMDEGVNGGHYQNIMSPNYDSVGIGLYYKDGILWLTEDFLQSSYAR